MTEKQKKASEYFRQGYNCSQSVLMAFDDVLKKDKNELAAIAVGLGGGVGRMREVCGCVTGMALVLSMKYGTGDPGSKKTIYPMVQKACNKFKEINGSIVCRELLSGTGATTGGQPEPRTEEYYRKRPCAELVEIATGIAEEIIGNVK